VRPQLSAERVRVPTTTGGLQVTGGGSLIRGLLINGANIGIALNTTGSNIVQGNWIGFGTDDTGAIVSLANDSDAIAAAAPDNLIGGLTPAARNVLSNSGMGPGIEIFGRGNVVQNNFIGTTPSGGAAGNGFFGVTVTQTFFADTLIGGTVPSAGNTIRFNLREGILLNTSTGNVIQGNQLIDSNGATASSTFDGIAIRGASNLVGGTCAPAKNQISSNSGAGVSVADFMDAMANEVPGVQNGILGNSIFVNGGLGIALTSTQTQDAPALTAVLFDGVNTRIQGMVASAPSTSLRIEFFSVGSCDPSGFGEGDTFFGATLLATDGTGNASFDVTLPGPSGSFVTATATDFANNTSAFSQCVVVAPAPTSTAVTPTPSPTASAPTPTSSAGMATPTGTAGTVTPTSTGATATPTLSATPSPAVTVNQTATVSTGTSTPTASVTTSTPSPTPTSPATTPTATAIPVCDDRCAVAAALEVACPCSAPVGHTQYRRCVAQFFRTMPGLSACKAEAKRCAARSICGKAAAVACSERGVCRIRSSAERCEQGGGAVLLQTSCCADCAGPTPTVTPRARAEA
jgi:parallel beta-helix repeat protein